LRILLNYVIIRQNIPKGGIFTLSGKHCGAIG